MHQQLALSDAIIALGSLDNRTAERAAELWHNKLAPVVIVAGGFGRLTGEDNSESESAKFKKVLLSSGVDEGSILVEDQSTNTAENLSFAVRLLQKRNNNISNVIIVTVPFSEKRTFATFRKLLPSYNAIFTSPQISYEDYPDSVVSKDLIINCLVGDTQRVKLYPSNGYTIEQEMSREVEEAMNELIKLGYSQQLAE